LEPYNAECQEIKRRWQECLRKAGIYERFYDANIKNIQARGIPEQIRTQYKQITDYLLHLEKNTKTGRGLILKGPPGTMKTTLAVAILQEAIFYGYSGRKILMQSLLDEIFMMKARGIEEWLKFENELRNCRLLVVDELGKHSSEGWVMTKFEAIVSERHERRRSTIFITNLTSKELKGLYSEGVIDRFNHVNDVVNFEGKSLRVKGD